MQTSTTRRSSRSLRKTHNQPKISGFFTKPALEAAPASPRVPEIDETPLRSPNEDSHDDPLGGGVVETHPLPIVTINKEEKEREVIVIEDSPLRPPPPKTLDTPNVEFPNLSHPKMQPNPVKKKKPVHPFFVARTAATTNPSTHKAARQKDSPVSSPGNQLPPWPNSENVHCGFSERILGAHVSIFPLRFASMEASSAIKATKSNRALDVSNLINLTAPSPGIIEHNLSFDSLTTSDSLPDEHLQNPAISRLFSPYSKLPSNRTWNDKYAPTKAHEVLQNDENATYMRSWLKALEIQLENTGQCEGSRGTKRPRLNVQRDVPRKRRKRSGELDDFIADDDDIEDESDEELDLGDDDGGDEDLSIGDDLPRGSTISSPLSSRFPSPLPAPLTIPRGTKSRPLARRIIESSPANSPLSSVQDLTTKDPVVNKATGTEHPSFSERLTNTILLKGPCGSGKTAAVYACAQELGWKVFEFYPGIGKRSGAGFMNEVGGTGENHRVGGLAAHLHPQAPDTEPQGFSQAQGFGFLTSPSKKRAHEPSPTPSHATLEKDGGSDVRQSLILVEEADILYQSDGNFWPTLINFIRKSRRPVVITCNDVSSIPLGDLPLQSTLEFKACDIELATSYLQAIALAEGHSIPRNAARRIYDEEAVYYPIAGDVPDQPMPPVASQGPLFSSDLKRAINQLQFHCIAGRLIPPSYQYSLSSLGDWGQESAVTAEQIKEVKPRYSRKTPPHEDLEHLLQLSEFVDSISFGDAYVDRRLKSTLELESTDRYGTNADDLQGNTLLRKVPEPEEAFGVALWPRDEDMAVCVAYQARLGLEQRGYGQMARRGLMARRVARTLSTRRSENSGEDDTGESRSIWRFNTMDLALQRAAYQKRIVDWLDEKLWCTGPLLPRPGCTLDYIPWMQDMARRMHGDGVWMSKEGAGVLVSEALV